MLINKLILTQLLSLSFALPSLNRREVINDGNQVSSMKIFISYKTPLLINY